MLTNSFIHIPGVGPRTEQLLWASGVLTWDDFVPPYPRRLSPLKIGLIRHYLERCQEEWAVSPKAIARMFGPAESWRLFPEFRHALAFLDIETTGLAGEGSEITTIALYDGISVFYYVQGGNLDAFPEHIKRYEAIVTYNGRCFDAPVIERFFGITLDHVHIDLRYVLRALGYSGGLKACEQRLGLDRGELAGVDGYLAVLLWHEYRRNNNQKALETLLAYNIQDAINLETLLVLAYNMNLRNTPFALTKALPLPELPEVPLRADAEIVAQLRSEAGQRW